jgi:hypothetical protein
VPFGLRAISVNLVSTAKNGSLTANRLYLLAHSQSEQIKPNGSLEENDNSIRSAMMLQNGANEAAQIGMNLLNANKKVLEVPFEPPSYEIPDDPVEASRAYAKLLGHGPSTKEYLEDREEAINKY